jgi:tetratricopeptide (TPR) repeat protein
MTIPALGLVWIFTVFLCRQKEKIRYYALLTVLVLFIPSVILNAFSYKNESSFWMRAQKSSPRCGYVGFQIARSLHEQKNFLAAELNLNKILSMTIEKETAIAVSLLYADIEYQKANYENVLKWMKSIEEFENAPNIQLAPFIKYHINYKKALVDLARGDASTAETLFLENIKRYPNIKESYAELYNLYIGSEQWEKAQSLEPQMKGRFPAFFKGVNTARAMNEFSTSPPDKKIALSIQYRNFSRAITLVETMAPLDLSHKLLLSKLYYWAGREAEGKKIVEEILKNNPGDFKILNTIGQFYLNDLLQVREATVYFDQSLAINKSQPEVIYMDNSLKEQYLKNIVPVWK